MDFSDRPLRHALAIDCSTDRLSLALAVGALPSPGATCWGEPALLSFEGEGSAKASTNLLPEVLALLAQAGLRVQDLGVIAYGRGPGAFTGLRTACSATQGLAFGAGDVPVVGVDSLMAVAQQARLDGTRATTITALLDARMDEIYAATYHFDGALLPAQVPLAVANPSLISPDHVGAYVSEHQPGVDRPALSGNTQGVYGPRWTQAPWVANHVAALPTAVAMLHLLPALWAAGQATDAAMAMPVYVRDQVALTTAERAALKPV